MLNPIHPFPARMAPEIAFKSLQALPEGSAILDPMSGSGTVLQQAVINGHKAIGFDMDPLAVLMSNASTKPICGKTLDELYNFTTQKAKSLNLDRAKLNWIDDDQETLNFIKYWFAPKQRIVLRKISYILNTSRKLKANENEANLLRIALSKLIVTKHSGASLAWDVSHSRPHKVRETNDFDVWKAFERNYVKIKNIILKYNIAGTSNINLGDARNMSSIASSSIDAVITSPPYLNAIDYLRGHKLSLIWLGYTISEIRNIRGQCIGVERGYVDSDLAGKAKVILTKLKDINSLENRQIKMIERYAIDAYLFMGEVARVLKNDGHAILVVGNSCLRNVFIENSKIFVEAGKQNGLILAKRPTVRDLPSSSRYLPLPKEGMLSKRMRTEVILKFTHSKNFKHLNTQEFCGENPI